MIIGPFLRLLKRLPRRNRKRNTEKETPVLLNQDQSQNQVAATDSARDLPSNNFNKDILYLLNQFGPNIKETLVREIQGKCQIMLTSDEIQNPFFSENFPSQHLQRKFENQICQTGKKTTKNIKVIEIIDKHASSNASMMKFLNLAQKIHVRVRIRR